MIVLIALGGSQVAHAKTWPVAPDSVPSLQEVLTEQARDGDTIELAEGLYEGVNLYVDLDGLRIVGTGDRAAHLVAGPKGAVLGIEDATGVTVENLTLQGAGGQVAWVAGVADATLRDVTLKDGYATGWGGGLWTGAQTTVLVQGATLRGNEAAEGGGGIVSNGTLTVRDTRVEDNEATQGGGLFCTVDSTCVVQDSTFVGNQAERGGGAFLDQAQGDFLRTTFCGNDVDSLTRELGDGGAVMFFMGSGSLQNSVLLDNTAYDVSGGVYALESEVALTNNTFVGNQAHWLGSAIYGWGSDSTLTLRNNLFVDNVSNQQLSGTVIETDSAASVQGGYNVLWGNDPGDVVSEDADLSMDPTLLGDPRLTALTQRDPRCDGSVLPDPYDPSGATFDAGDPTLSDPDGTRSDIGATGGPLALRDRDGDGSFDGTTSDRDCDDLDAGRAPHLQEVCGGGDEDCDGREDDDDPSLDTSTFPEGYVDEDGDGFGGRAIEACVLPDDAVTVGGDCDDAVAGVNPAVPEVCDDGIDNDCDGRIDLDCDVDALRPPRGDDDLAVAGCRCASSASSPAAWWLLGLVLWGALRRPRAGAT
ncbi:MAG: right-handed parallel beta-helix repeat-containing protein [Myxococcales bacterium]|nr:right-handed parallel beta-helix repeat-containing protein [Myxococcales bacterium]